MSTGHTSPLFIQPNIRKWTEQITDWRTLGHWLRVPILMLETIEQVNGHDLSCCKEEVLHYWIKNDQTASWKTLADAIESMGGHMALVQGIRKNCLKEGHPIPPRVPFDLPNLLKRTEQIMDWRLLGHWLKVPLDTLDTIEQNRGGDVRRCKEDVLNYWINNNMTASWEALADVIEHMGGYIVLVQDIRNNCCKQVTLPSTVAGSSSATFANLPLCTTKKPEGDSTKKPLKRPNPAGDSKVKPSKQPKPAGDKPAAKKSKDPGPVKQPSIPKQSWLSSTGTSSTSLLSRPSLPQVNPSQLSGSSQLSRPTATETLLLSPDKIKKEDNAEEKRKGKKSGGNESKQILMSYFVQPEYRVDKTADDCYKCSILHPLFNCVMGYKCKTEEAARQSAANKVIKHLNEKHNFKISASN